MNSAFLLAGCAKARAASAPDGPPLVVPAAPSRVLAPVDEPLVVNPPTTEQTATPPRAARPAPAPRRPPTANAPTEPEAKPDAPVAQPPATPPPDPTVAAPRPAPVPADAAAERRVREVLARAARDLNRIDYKRLSTDGKAQYEQSKRFTEQTEQALKDRNYVFAATLADKAAALATELLGR